ncbi:MAG TPA: hypothetical protein PL185_05015 [Flavobacteriales bacterium]|nr:hypothetical protein [Flavobacteriales bacterium]HPH81906.1 hypothetical protein [Flavobacteriales bacterium]
MRKLLLTLVLTFSFACLIAQPLAISTELTENGQVELIQWDGDGFNCVSSEMPMMYTWSIYTNQHRRLFSKWREKRRVKKYNNEEVVYWENGQEPEASKLDGLVFTPARNASWGIFPYWVNLGFSDSDTSIHWQYQEYTTQTFNCRGGAYYNTYFYTSKMGKNSLPDSIFYGSVYRIDTVSKKDTSSCWEYFYNDQEQLTKIVVGDMTQRSYQPAFNRSILLFEYTAKSQLKRIIGLSDTLNYDSYPLTDSLFGFLKKGFYLSDDEEDDLIDSIQYQKDGPEISFLLEYEYQDSLLIGSWIWSKDWSNFLHDSIAYNSNGKVISINHLAEVNDIRGTLFNYDSNGRLTSYQEYFTNMEDNELKREFYEQVNLKYIRRKDIPQEEDSSTSSDQ